MCIRAPSVSQPQMTLLELIMRAGGGGATLRNMQVWGLASWQLAPRRDMLLVSPALTMLAGSKHEKFFKGSLELPFCLTVGVNTPSHTADGSAIWRTTFNV